MNTHSNKVTWSSKVEMDKNTKLIDSIVAYQQYSYHNFCSNDQGQNIFLFPASEQKKWDR